ncbi:zinc finger protein 570-like [Lytechinus variegatus]|uniref:zinc finger protein 570-like n=1 Tax=Lytechinus variegatus TaxID=7654 RepID=UPI001BB2AD45|nr:zinc finger protein 570-like [Lytechinus variegatus]
MPGKVKETVATSSSLPQANLDRREVIQCEALSIQSQKGERMHLEYLDNMQEREGPAPRDRWTNDGGDTHGDTVGSKEMEARWTNDGDTHGDVVGSKEKEARWTDDGGDTHGDVVNSKEMEARWTDDGGDIHGDAVNSKEMEARWTDDGGDTHSEAVNSKEMEARWTDDGGETDGDVVSSKGIAAHPSEVGELHCLIKQEPEDTNSDDDITNKDDTNGLHNNEMEVRSSGKGALECVIKEEPVDIGEEDPVDFIKKEPVSVEGSYLHEGPSCSTQDENSSQLSFHQRSENIQVISGDTSYDRSHDQEHLLEDSSDTVIGSQSSLSAHDGHSRGSGFLLNVDCSQGSSSSEVVSEANSFLCSVCKMVFENRHDLCKHLKHTHGVEKPYDCTLCRRSYKFRCELKRHLKGHTGEKCRSGSSSSEVVSEANTFLCSVCKKVFNEKDGLCKHLKFIRRVEKPHECTICSRNFKFRCELKRHLRDHKGEMRHAFSSGDKRIWDMYKLNDLMAVRMSGKKRFTKEKQFQCSFCSKTFTGNSSLNRHVKSHMEGKPFQCTDCSMRFLDASALAKHATMHSGEKPFECSICGKRYANKYHFADHMKLHTGERPYACPMCERRFIRKADMKRHVTIHTGERPYACSMCPKRFRNRNTFVLHYEKTHRY